MCSCFHGAVMINPTTEILMCFRISHFSPKKKGVLRVTVVLFLFNMFLLDIS